MRLAISILIYFVTFVIHIIMCYRENRRRIIYVRDLLDEIQFYMWFPIINTLTLLGFAVCIVVMKLWKIFKLDIIWEKFNNIKLKK